MKINKYSDWNNIKIECKPDFLDTVKRYEAWREFDISDRPIIRFTSHNAFFRDTKADENVGNGKRWESYTQKWFDVDYKIETYLNSLSKKPLLGDNLPVCIADFSPAFYSTFFGVKLAFNETTGWALDPVLHDYTNIDNLTADLNTEIYATALKLVEGLLKNCNGKFLVGLPDLYAGMDTIDPIRGTQDLLIDMIDEPENVKKLIDKTTQPFFKIYDSFYDLYKKYEQPVVNFLNMPLLGKNYIPAADLSTMFSQDCFKEYALDNLCNIMQHMDFNTFHLDGKGVAKHIDYIMQLPNLGAIQWVQGVGSDRPIMQWSPLIHKILNSKIPIVVDVDKEDLQDFIDEFKDPRGICLQIETYDIKEQQEIINKITDWK